MSPRKMSTVMSAVPMLVSPAFASVQLGRSTTGAPNASQIVINSSPTVVIYSNQPEQVEQRVLEVLSCHREDLFMQWCAELKRRQRTEF